jgi:hypothetical protein
VADIWSFAKSMKKLIGFRRRKPQISATAKMRSKPTLRERRKETPEPHSINPVISSELIESTISFLKWLYLCIVLDMKHWFEYIQMKVFSIYIRRP